MDLQQAIQKVIQHQDLDADEMIDVMRLIMTGKATAAQIGGFLVALRMKGESVDEIAAAAGVMRGLAEHVDVEVECEHLLDTCGTGGDGASTFNISTACAFVVAAAGGHVAKHGNRSISSSSGSADLLEAAGVKIDLKPDQVARCIEQVGVGFMFAPSYHGAMKHAIGPRREMATRTIFNVLGPLTNPADASAQLLGVFSNELLEPLVRVLQKLGSQHVMVVHAEDGLDEISIGARTQVCELVDGEIKQYSLSPKDFGIKPTEMASLAVDDAEQSLDIIQSVFAGEQGAAADVVALNAGAAIYVCDLVDDIAEGVNRARELLSQGAVEKKFKEFIRLSNSFGD